MSDPLSLFSSPSKTATAAGQAQQSLSQNEINQAEGYVSDAQQNERKAIAGTGDNPYFGGTTGKGGSSGPPTAAPAALNAFDTTSFGPSGAGSSASAPGITTQAPGTTLNSQRVPLG